MTPLCIYHGNCADGFGAAWAARKALNAEVEFFAGVYQNPPPANIDGRDIVMVDFSYKRDVLLQMAEKARSIIVIDHHKSAQMDLISADLPSNVHTEFDMEHSGAVLTWRYLFEEEPPKLLYHIEDRDLWRFRLYGTREIQATVVSHPYDFATWDALMATDTDELYREGVAIERKHHKDIAELLSVTRRRMVIGGWNVPVACLPYTLSSDAGHLMAKGEPFAACYYDTPEGRVFSLRSAEDGMDVSEIAVGYGGGGHKHSAGFRVPYSCVIEGETTVVLPQKAPEVRRSGQADLFTAKAGDSLLVTEA